MGGTDSEVAGYVLLVEDTPLNQKLEKMMLEHCGCRVDVAPSGREALLLTGLNRYDMIFMDCQMPGMDGYAATGAIREMEAGKGGEGATHTPIVALTAYAMEGDREKCLRAGMDDYLNKPFGMEALQAIVARWLSPPAAADGVSRRATDGGIPAALPVDNDRETAAPVDRAALERLAALQPPGKNAALRKIISLYVDQAERLITALCGAVSRHDPAALEGAAHTLKSCSASLGAVSLAAICRELELLGRGRSLAGAGELLAALERGYPPVREFLQRYRDSLA